MRTLDVEDSCFVVGAAAADDVPIHNDPTVVSDVVPVGDTNNFDVTFNGHASKSFRKRVTDLKRMCVCFWMECCELSQARPVVSRDVLP